MTGAHQRIVSSYIGHRYSLTGDSLKVELCPAVAAVVDTNALAQMALRGKLAVRSVRTVPESQCTGEGQRTSDDLILRILSTRLTGDSFVVTAERRRPSNHPHSWRERWIELADDPALPRGHLVMCCWPAIE